jgi:hypothetical protein
MQAGPSRCPPDSCLLATSMGCQCITAQCSCLARVAQGKHATNALQCTCNMNRCPLPFKAAFNIYIYAVKLLLAQGSARRLLRERGVLLGMRQSPALRSPPASLAPPLPGAATRQIPAAALCAPPPWPPPAACVPPGSLPPAQVGEGGAAASAAAVFCGVPQCCVPPNSVLNVP